MLRSLLLVAVLSASIPAMAQTAWYVDDDAPNDPGPNDHLVSDPLEDGSVDHPFDRLQEAVSAAADGDTILVLAGFYQDSQPISLSERALTIQGAGAAVTILDGAISSDRIMTITDSVAGDVILEGMTFQNGSGFTGGAINMAGNQIGTTIRNCDFLNNTASVQGSAVNINSNGLLGGVSIEDCRFEQNIASGAVSGSVVDATVQIRLVRTTFVRCVFRNNHADGGGAGIGAADPQSLIVRDCLFEDNSSGQTATIHLFSPIGFATPLPALIVGSTFVRNEGAAGGALYIARVPSLIDRSVMRGNISADLGGALLIDEADVVLTNVEIVGNVAGNDGGAAVIRNLGAAHFENCTITANHAEDAIGGVFPMGSGNFASLLNTICIDNTSVAPNANTNYGGTGAASVYSTSYSIVPTANLAAGADVGPGNFVANPMFVSAPSPGPDGDWGTMDDDYGDLRLALGASPAIDAGNSPRYAGPLQDLGGMARLVDDSSTTNTGNDAGMAPIDIGAHEAQAAQCVADFNGDGVVNGADLATLLASWGICP